MSNAQKANGTNFNVSNKPGTNGAPEKDWENLGNLFLDSSGRRGTLYLNVTVAQLETLLAQAKAAQGGKLERKFSLFPRKPKAPAAGAAAAQPAA